MDLNLPAFLAVVGLIALGLGLFPTFSLIIACIVKTRDRFVGVGQVLTTPILFASNAIHPIDIMPSWPEGSLIGESAHLSGRCAAGADADRRRQQIWAGD